MICSLTKAAAHEIAGRGIPIADDMVGTLHAHCYRSLGHPDLAEANLKQWNEEHSSLQMSGGKQNVDDMTESNGDNHLAIINVQRAMLKPVESWPASVQTFWKKWVGWKESNGYLDFTDLIETCANDVEKAHGNPGILLGDEAQDWSKLEFKLFVDKWGKHADTVVLSGDFDQCQPGDTMVETSRFGKVRIDQLDPKIHKLLSYDRHDKKVYGKTKGYKFKINSRKYHGHLFEFITANGLSSKCTPNHKWFVKWAKEVRSSKLRCVYLMRKGDNFRVGHCQLFNVERNFHLKTRAYLEGADDFWILKTFDSSVDSFAYEQIISARYGIPQIVFKAGNVQFPQESIDKIFDSVDSSSGANQCLCDHKLNINYPFILKEGKHSNLLKIYACNIIPGLMQVPEYNGTSRPEWSLITNRITHISSGEVYSLDVDKYHTYIADNLCTCNSIFLFRGSDPYYFLNNPVPQENKKVREQSFRVPRAVHSFARSWIRRIRNRDDVQYSPVDRDGKISKAQISLRDHKKLITEIKARLTDGKTCMLLASCAFMLKPVIAELKLAGIPFGNSYRKQNALWNPLGRRKNATMAIDRVASFLAPKIRCEEEWRSLSMRKWTQEEFNKWASVLKTGVLTRGTKSAISETTYQIPESFGEYNTLFMEEDDAHKSLYMDLEWYVNALQDKHIGTVGYASKVAGEYDIKGIAETPPVTVGTIHSVKGGEADCVFLFPDLSREGMAEYVGGGEGTSSVIRLFYVGMTRAREELILCQPQSKLGVEF